MTPLGLFFGALVGFALGLTGGGGSLFAVPLLVYGLSVTPHEAVGVSLAAVGTTSLFGAVQRMRTGQTDVRTGVIFALFGMAGAPLGSWINRRTPEAVLLLLFAALMLLIATRMWRRGSAQARGSMNAGVSGPVGGGHARGSIDAGIPGTVDGAEDVQGSVNAGMSEPGGPADARGSMNAGTFTTPPAPKESRLSCQRDAAGRLRLTARCAWVMSGAGVGTGILSGLFGVGGGFIIVPALTFFTGMEIHRAVATSLLVIAMVSSAGVISFVSATHHLDLALTGTFVLGGIAGMYAGIGVSKRISGPRLQQVFAGFIIAVAIFVILRTLLD